MLKVAVLALSLVFTAEGPVLANGFVFPERVVQFDFVEKGGTLEDGRTFLVVAKKRAFTGDADPLSGVTFLGGDGDPPRFVLERFEVSIDGTPVAIPQEARIDLSDPDLPGGVRVNQGDGAMVVHVIGGDGAGSYRVSLLIRDGKLVARKIDQHGRPPRIENF